MVVFSAQGLKDTRAMDLNKPWHRHAPERPLLMAHRGAPTCYPENTLVGFRAALDAGADVIEMDVRTSADGVLMVIHDETVDRVSDGRGAVNAFTAAELQALRLKGAPPRAGDAYRIPQLNEVFAAFPQAAMNVDLKAVSDEHVAQVFASIRAVRGRPQANLRVLLTSSSDSTQQAIASHNQAGEVLLGMSRKDVLAVLKAAWLQRPPIERLRGRACQMPAYLPFLRVNVPLLAGPLHSYLAQMGCPLHVWWGGEGMIDNTYRLDKCIKWSVDGIFTNAIGTMAAPRLFLEHKSNASDL